MERQFGLVNEEPVDDLAMLVHLVVEVLPGGLASAELGAKGRIFAACPGQHTDEPAAVLVHVGHVLGGSQLAIGHVEEVAPAGQLTEEVPRLAMSTIVGGIPTLDAEVHGDRTITCHREDVEQLLQVGAMVLVVAPGDGPPKLPPERAFLVGVLVVTVERDGGGVVVEFVEGHAKRAHHVLGHPQCQGRNRGIEQVIEASADAIVIERGRLLGRKAQELGDVPACPFAHAVEGLAGQQDVLQQDEQGGRGGDRRTRAFAGEVVTEEMLEAQFREDMIEDRQRGDLPRREGLSVGLGHGAGARLVFVSGAGATVVRRAFHGSSS